MIAPFNGFGMKFPDAEHKVNSGGGKNVKDTMSKLFQIQGTRCDESFDESVIQVILKKLDSILKSLGLLKTVASTKPVRSWDVDDVQHWLGSSGLEDYKAEFKKRAIEGPDLLDLTAEDLPDLKITDKFHVKKILRFIASNKEGASEVVSPLSPPTSPPPKPEPTPVEPPPKPQEPTHQPTYQLTQPTSPTSPVSPLGLGINLGGLGIGVGNYPTGFGGAQPGFGGAQPGFGGTQPGFGDQPTGFGHQPTGFGHQPTGFGHQPTGFGGGFPSVGGMFGHMPNPTNMFHGFGQQQHPPQ